MTREEWVLWTRQEATVEFLAYLKARLEEVKDAWAHEAFAGTDVESLAIANATALGGVRVINSILNEEYMPDE